MAQDEDFLGSVETLIRKNTAQRRDGLRVQGARAPEPVVRRRPAPRAAGRPPRHPAPDDQPADGRRGPRALVGPRGRAGHRRGARALARASPCSSIGSTSSGWSARRAPGPRTPRSWPTRSGIPAVMGAAGALAAIPTGDDAAAGRAERHASCSIPPATSWRRPRPRSAGGTSWSCSSRRWSSEPAVTPGGRPILLMGNVDLPEEIEAAVRHGRPGRRAAAHRVPAHRARRAPHRDRAGRLLPPRRYRVPRAHGHHPLLRPGRRQVPGRVQGSGRGQPVSRLALHPGLPRSARGVPASGAGGAPGRARPRRPAHAAARHAGGGGGEAREIVLEEGAGTRCATASGRRSRCRSAS